MPSNFPEVFSALRGILARHVGKLVVTEDTLSCYRLEGGMHPTHKKPFPIAWVSVDKAYVSFHHMGIYARPGLAQRHVERVKSANARQVLFQFYIQRPGAICRT